MEEESFKDAAVLIVSRTVRKGKSRSSCSTVLREREKEGRTYIFKQVKGHQNKTYFYQRQTAFSMKIPHGAFH